MAKMMSPNTTIWWAPSNGIADMNAPTVAEITAATNISAAIVTGFKLGAVDSATDSSKTIVDEGNVKTPTFGNYEASLSFYRDAEGDAPSVFSTAFALFEAGRVDGWLISRHGYKHDTAPVAGQEVSVFKVVSDFHHDVEANGGAPIQVTVPFKPQGQMALNVLIAA